MKDYKTTGPKTRRIIVSRYKIGDIVNYKGTEYKVTDRVVETKRNWKLQIVPYYVYAISRINQDGIFVTLAWFSEKELEPHWTEETKLGELL